MKDKIKQSIGSPYDAERAAEIIERNRSSVAVKELDKKKPLQRAQYTVQAQPNIGGLQAIKQYSSSK